MAPRDFVRDLNAAAERAGRTGAQRARPGAFCPSVGTPQCGGERARGESPGSGVGLRGARTCARCSTRCREHSLLFAANSMSIRAVDGFCGKGAQFDILCNRGLNGIDGTLSTALGAAQAYRQTTLLTGDLALLHDLPAFSLNAELMRVHREAGELAAKLYRGAVEQPWRRHFRHASAKVRRRLLRALVPHARTCGFRASGRGRSICRTRG